MHNFLLGALFLLSAFSSAAFADSPIRMLFPRPSQVFYPERPVRIDWVKDSSTAVDVLYALDNQSGWTRIAAAVRRTDFEWTLPALDSVGISFKVQIASLKKPELLDPVFNNRVGVQSCTYNAKGNYILSTMRDGTANLRTADNAFVISTDTLTDAEARACTFYTLHPDTAVIAVGKELVLFNIYTFSNLVRFGADEHNGVINAVAAHPSKDLIATACADGYVRIWSVPQRKILRTLSTIENVALNTISFSKDGEVLLYAGDNGIVYVDHWMDESASRVELRGHGNGTPNFSVSCAAFAPDGKTVVSGGIDYSIRVWDIGTASQRLILLGHSAPISSLKLSPDGTRILSAAADSTVRQWSAATGEEIHAALPVGDVVSAVDYTPGGDTLLGACYNTGSMFRWKSIHENGASDSVRGVIRYPISLRVGNVTASVGSTATIPILFERVVNVPYFERTRFEATCSITLPARLVAVDETDPRFDISRGVDYDTVRVPLVFSANDTVGRVPVRMLLTDKSSDTITLLQGARALEWANGVRAFVLDRAIDGTVTASASCVNQNGRSVIFLEQKDPELFPNPVEDFSTLSFTAYEEGYYTISITNELGQSVYNVLSQYLQPGEKQIAVDMRSLGSGTYRCLIKAPSVLRSLSLVKMY